MPFTFYSHLRFHFTANFWFFSILQLQKYVVSTSQAYWFFQFYSLNLNILHFAFSKKPCLRLYILPIAPHIYNMDCFLFFPGMCSILFYHHSISEHNLQSTQLIPDIRASGNVKQLSLTRYSLRSSKINIPFPFKNDQWSNISLWSTNLHISVPWW